MKTPVLNDKEKLRHRYSAEYFSRGVSSYLKDKMVDDVFDGLSKKIDNLKQKVDKKKKDIEKLKKGNLKGRVAKFVVISGLVVTAGYVAIKKLSDAFDSLNETISKNVGTVEDSLLYKKSKEITDELYTKVKKDYITPVTSGVAAVLGIGQDNVNQLKNPKLRKLGLFGYLINQFGLVSVQYLFSKEGYGWILDLLNVNGPNYHDISIGMWQEFSKDTSAYSFLGNGIQAAKILTEHKQHLEKGFNIMSSNEYTKDSFIHFDNISFIKEHIANNSNNIAGVTSNKRFDPKNIQIIDLQMIAESRMPEGFWSECGEFFKVCGRGISNAFDSTVNVEVGGATQYNIAMQRVYEGDSRMMHSSILGRQIPYPDISDDDNTREQEKGIKESVEYIDNVLLMMKSYEPESFNEYYKHWDAIIQKYPEYYNEADTHDEFYWSYDKFSKMLQFIIFVGQWETYQALNSIVPARGFFNQYCKVSLEENTSKLMDQYLEHEKNRAERFAINYAKGIITFEDAVKEGTIKIQKYTKENLNVDDVKQKLRENFISAKKSLYEVIPYNEVKKLFSDLSKITKQHVLRQMSGGRQVSVINSQDIMRAINLKGKAQRANGYTSGIHEEITGPLYDGVELSNDPLDSESADKIGLTPYKLKAKWDGGLWLSFEGWKRVGIDDNGPAGVVDIDDEPHQHYADKVGEKNLSNGWWYVDKSVYYNNDGDAKYYVDLYKKPWIGYAKKMKYQMVDKDYKIWSVELMEYTDYSGSHRGTEFLSKKLSEDSLVGRFQDDMNKGEGNNIPDDVRLELFLEKVTIMERSKKEILRERYEILSNILEISNDTELTFYDISLNK